MGNSIRNVRSVFGRLMVLMICRFFKLNISIALKKEIMNGNGLNFIKLIILQKDAHSLDRSCVSI
jgi:hypothetical protein